MRSAIPLALMLVAVPLATAVPASADHIDRVCFDSDCSINELEHAVIQTVDDVVWATLGFAQETVDNVLELVDALRDSAERLVQDILNCDSDLVDMTCA